MSYRRNLRSRWMWAQVWQMTKTHWSESERQMAGSFSHFPEVTVRTADDAEWLGMRWYGQPYTVYPPQDYDLLDHLVAWADNFLYLMSGQWTAEMCAEEDERLLAYATG